MACVDAKGELTQSARNLLVAIEHDALSPEMIAEHAKLPLFKVRSTLRDMRSMGFVIETDGKFQISEGAKKLLAKR